MSRHHRIKAAEDQRLLSLITKLQGQIAANQALDMNTFDFSTDNEVEEKILRAKYVFAYHEARRRQTRSTNIYGVITE